MNKLKIIQINLNGCKVSQDLLSQTEMEHGAGISLISEPYIVKDDETWMTSKDGNAAIHLNMNNMTNRHTKEKWSLYGDDAVDGCLHCVVLHLTKCR